VGVVSLRRSGVHRMENMHDCSNVFLMLVVFAGVLLAISKASGVAGDAVGSVWPSLVSILAFMLLTMFAAAVVVWAILHTASMSK